jgi:hypothetical protein
VDEQHRPARAGMQIMHARALDVDEAALNWWEALVHLGLLSPFGSDIRYYNSVNRETMPRWRAGGNPRV